MGLAECTPTIERATWEHVQRVFDDGQNVSETSRRLDVDRITVRRWLDMKLPEAYGMRTTAKVAWSGFLTSIQKRIRLTRSFDERTQSPRRSPSHRIASA
jgi:hypothetical protein